MHDSTWGRLAVVLGAVGLTGPAMADGVVGYAQATGYFKQDSRPTLYQPLGLLDARDATAWCTRSSDPLNDTLTFGFDGPITIDELRISNGNNFDESTFGDFARARKLRFSSGKDARTFTVEDARGLQAVTLSPALTGTRFTLQVLDPYPADDLEQPVCLTDVVFVADGKALNGPWMAAKLKYDKHAAQLMGTWFSGYDKTPDRFLSFNYDGTFRYSREPFDTTRVEPKVIVGRYDVSPGRLVLTIDGKRHALKFTKSPGKHGSTLDLDGDLPADLKGPWRGEP